MLVKGVIMGEIKFHRCGKDMFRIGNYTYFTKHLENKQPANVVGLRRYNRVSGKYETYNPHTEGPGSKRGNNE